MKVTGGMAQVSCIIICPNGSAYPRVAATIGSHGQRSPALLQVGAEVVLDQWLSALQSCSWLLPVQQKLYIVCDAGQQAHFQAWAERSPQAHQAGFLGGKQILSAPLGSSMAPNHAAALSAFAALGSLQDMLIVIDGARLCEPGFSLHRFIQHSLVRGKDCLAFSSGPTEHFSQQVQLQLEGSSANPRVIGLQALQSGSASHGCCMAPVFAFKGISLPKLVQSGAQAVSEAVQVLFQSGDVYGVPVQCSFDLSNLDGYLYADAFFCFYQQHWKLLHGQTGLSASSALQINTGEAGVSGVDTAPMHAALLEFNHSYAAAMTAEAYARYMQGRSGVLGMPERFTDASLWRWRRKQQHPVYMTSNNDYGAKPPSQQMLPPSWHGVKGEFTKNYIKNEIRTGNFSTGLPSSRVHDALTELC